MWRFVAGFLLVTISALAQDVAQTVSVTQPKVENNPNSARIIWLDKQTNTRTSLTLNQGAAQTFGTLAVRLERCAMDINSQPNTDAAWLVVSEPGRGNDWFAGWMINTLPEVATLDHPRYDLQLVGCGSQPRKKAGPVARSGKVEVGQDTETGGAGAEGTDPFYVPGLESPTTPAPATEPVSSSEALPETPATAPATPILEENAAPAAPAPSAQEQMHQLMDGVY
jgi:hypothetical protein